MTSCADLHIEGGAEPDDRGPLLDRDPPILRGPHREAGQSVVGGKLGEAGEMGARVLRVLAEGRHRHQPADRDRAALEKRTQVRWRHASLALLAGHVDLDQDLRLWPAVAAELLER